MPKESWAYVVRVAAESELPAVAELIAKQNARAETQCLHSEDVAATALARMHKAAQRGDGLAVVALRGDEIVGAVACEHDVEAGRLWTWGPFAEDSHWEHVAPLLLEALEAATPDGVVRIDAFLNELNTRALDLYRSRGFEEKERHHIYVCERRNTTSFLGVTEADDAQVVEAGVLHEAVFPGTWLTGAALAAKRAGGDRVFVETDGGRVRGYLVAERFDEDGEGFVHFIGVSPDARGAGVGGRLLEAALAWLFDVEQAPRISLVVRDSLGGARALYSRAGFELEYTGIAMRRDR